MLVFVMLSGISLNKGMEKLQVLQEVPLNFSIPIELRNFASLDIFSKC
jgi:hypothetical protein